MAASERFAGLSSRMTIEEKAAILEGVRSWYTNAIPRLGIPSLCLTDGPHGVRLVREGAEALDVANNEQSTAFPTSATLASSWNPDLARETGRAIAEECRAAGVDVLLAPGVNIKRSPLCGRNFEYFSEDPLVSGIMGAAFVSGVRQEGIGCCVKHFAANSNEDYRFCGDSVVDERALREIYLKAFERIIKETEPYTVMCAYNRVNGTYAAQNRRLLTEILRDEWGYDGVVMTDWGATVDRVRDIGAGCDLEMPGGIVHNRRSVIEAATAGTLPMSVIDRAAERMLRLIDRCTARETHGNLTGETQEHHAELAGKIARESAVLLKNEGVLPLSRNEQLLVVGELFERMRYQGAGSSLINPPTIITPENAFDSRGIRYSYERGYRTAHPGPDRKLKERAVAAAREADTILFFGGLTDFEESEGFDRDHLRIGDDQIKLLEALVENGKPVVLVLFAGAPVEIPCFDALAGVLDMYLPGMSGGDAAAALLFGETNPSGRLAESWPLSAEDASSAADYNHGPVSEYYESIYVGYRYYDKARVPVRFPFGYGLSYTRFEYANLSVSGDGTRVTVGVDVTNTGGRDGAEVVQLYVKNNASEVFKSEKELRGFKKVWVAAGETARAEIGFGLSDLAYWDVAENGWVLENGTYEICIAASAADIRLSAPLEITTGTETASPYPNVVSADYASPPVTVPESFPELMNTGRKTDDADRPTGLEVSNKPESITENTRMSEVARTFFGGILYAFVSWRFRMEYRKAMAMSDSLERDARLKNAHFMLRMLPSTTIRGLAMSSSGRFPCHIGIGVIELVNRHPIRGLKAILSRPKPLPLPAEHESSQTRQR